MEIRENVGLAGFTTFRVGGPARWFAEAGSEAEVAEAFRWAAERGIRVEVLGGGSNLLVPDAGFDGLVLRLGLCEVTREGELFDVAGGKSWDRFVDVAIAAGMAGVECLGGDSGERGRNAGAERGGLRARGGADDRVGAGV